MKILILSFNFGLTSSGRSTERLTDGLHELGHSIEIICAKKYVDRKPYNIITVSPNPLSPAKFFNILGNLSGRELNYIFWEMRVKRKLDEIMIDFNPEFIVSRGSPISALKLGSFASKKYDVPHLIHFADPIPPTPDWMQNKLSRKKLEKTIKPIMKSATLMSFATEAMRAYQFESNLMPINYSSTFICPNPLLERNLFGPPRSSKFIFLYLGSLTIQRNPSMILEQFLLFANNLVDVEFHIYGNENNGLLLKKLGIESPKIKLFKQTDNITKVLSEAHVLIDIDPDYEKQVFISGKLMEYLSTDRFIVSFSPIKSPARQIIGQLKHTVFFCLFNRDEVYSVFSQVYHRKWNSIDFNERLSLYNEYGNHSISIRLQEQLHDVINHAHN